MQHTARRLAPIAVALSLAACVDLADNASATTSPAPSVLASVASAENATITGTASARVEAFGANGERSEYALPSWTFTASVKNGIGHSKRTAAAAETPKALADLGPTMGGFAPVVAIARGARSSKYIRGFRESGRDASGSDVSVIARPESDGSPIRSILVFRDGQLIVSVDMEWRAVDGGYVLARQSTSMQRGGALVMRITAEFEQTTVVAQSMLDRLAGRTLAIVADALLPRDLYASCAGETLQTVGGFVALIATAEAVITPPTAVAWVAGWVAWTGQLISNAEACDS